MKYRKKPVVIDAMQWDGSNVAEVDKFFDTFPEAKFVSGDCVEITTLEGTLLARPSDWIIRGVKGEFYPCKPDIFAATYEPAE